MATRSSTEAKLLRQIADEYRDRGYDVQLDPSPEHLPDFLSPFQPDAIAVSVHDKVIIEVKKSVNLRGNKRVEQLAAAVEGRPAWRFELATVGGAPTAPRLQPAAPVDIRDHLKTVQDLIPIDREAAVLVLSAQAEAVLRLIAPTAPRRRRPETGSTLAKTAYTQGSLSSRELQAFQLLFERRSAVAHGFEPATPDFQIAWALALVERLLDEFQFVEELNGLLVAADDFAGNVHEQLKRALWESSKIDSGLDDDYLAENDELQEIELDDVRFTSASDIDEQGAAIELTARGSATVSVWVPQDWAAEIHDPGFEVQDSEIADGFASALVHRRLVFSVTGYFDRAQGVVADLDLQGIEARSA